MKKAGILTINDNLNIGNRLQNYATQQIFSKRGLDIRTINNITDTGKKEKISSVRRIKAQITYILYRKRKLNLKRKKTQKFNNKYIRTTSYDIDINNKHEDKIKEFDYLIVGSDQVWNYNFSRFSQIDFADFKTNAKKIAFAASFGVKDIPDKYKKQYINGLRNFDEISTRENSGRLLVQELAQRDATVIIDPTMMLDKSDWQKIEERPNYIRENEKYILTYFLCEIDKEKRKQLKKLAKVNNCKIIDIMNIKKKYYVTSPSEFLYLIHNSFLVCTNSFHACVFSIIYGVPFLVYERENNSASMNSRIDTLLDKFNLQNKKYNGKITQENLKALETEKLNTILQEERQDVKDFIDRVLKNNNNKE